MRFRLLRSMTVAAMMAIALVTVGRLTHTSASALEPARVQNAAPAPQTAAAAKTPWGEPDLQGLWSVELLVPMQRPDGITTEFYTEEQVAELDRQRADTSVFGNHLRAAPGSEADVAGAYNPVFTSQRPTGQRTGMVIDPPDGKVPPYTPEAQARQAEITEFELALLQNTDVCRDNLPGCRGATYGPPSPRREERPPHYITNDINRADGPDDRILRERCMSGNLPVLSGGFTGIHYRIVQSPGVVTIYYDVGQGQGFNRVIPVTDAPHLPSHIRQWWGDSRGRWEGDTLVVDVTNFTHKTSFRGSRENLHLVERWSRPGPESLEVVTTIEDPTVWTSSWTVVEEFAGQNNEANRIYYEPRCHEGNYGLPGLLVGLRADERAFAEGRGPDPATKCLIDACASPTGRDPLALR